MPAYKVEVKNTTGSGDTFAAGLALKLSEFGKSPKDLEELELQRILRFANACGALVTTQEGARSAELSLNSIKEFLRREG